MAIDPFDRFVVAQGNAVKAGGVYAHFGWVAAPIVMGVDAAGFAEMVPGGFGAELIDL